MSWPPCLNIVIHHHQHHEHDMFHVQTCPTLCLSCKRKVLVFTKIWIRQCGKQPFSENRVQIGTPISSAGILFTNRQRDRQTDRHTRIHTDRQTGTHTNTHTETDRHTETDTHRSLALLLLWQYEFPLGINMPIVQFSIFFQTDRQTNWSKNKILSQLFRGCFKTTLPIFHYSTSLNLY